MTDYVAPQPSDGLQPAPNPSVVERTAGKSGRTLGGPAAERIFLLDRPQYVRDVPGYLDVNHGGLVLCGDGAASRTIELRTQGFTGALVEDAAAYERQVATEDAPFQLPEDNGLFRVDLDDVLQAQIDRGATWALTPSRYVPVGDSAPLKSIIKEAGRLAPMPGS